MSWSKNLHQKVISLEASILPTSKMQYNLRKVSQSTWALPLLASSPIRQRLLSFKNWLTSCDEDSTTDLWECGHQELAVLNEKLDTNTRLLIKTVFFVGLLPRNSQLWGTHLAHTAVQRPYLVYVRALQLIFLTYNDDLCVGQHRVSLAAISLSARSSVLPWFIRLKFDYFESCSVLSVFVRGLRVGLTPIVSLRCHAHVMHARLWLEVLLAGRPRCQIFQSFRLSVNRMDVLSKRQDFGSLD